MDFDLSETLEESVDYGTHSFKLICFNTRNYFIGNCFLCDIHLETDIIGSEMCYAEGGET